MRPKAYLSRSKTGTSVEEVLDLIPTQSESDALKLAEMCMKMLQYEGIPMEVRNQVVMTCIDVLGSLESCPYDAKVLILEKWVE